MIDVPGTYWILFNLLVLLLLALDLGVLNRRTHEIKFKEAIYWSGFWISLALLFNLFVFFWQGPEPALSFLAGYLIEKSLSVDNIFVFLIIFESLKIPTQYQHKVLYFGILGAMVLRAIFILAGVTLLEKVHWSIYFFGAILIVTGIRMMFKNDNEADFRENPVRSFMSKHFRIKSTLSENRFFTREDGKLYLTPLFLSLVLVETADVVFAVDSIPAILAVTPDPFIVYTSNVFAILGLRSLFFAFSGAASHIHYLHYGLAVILIFVGIKMVLSHSYPISTFLSLAIIGGILLITVIASIYFKPKSKKK